MDTYKFDRVMSDYMFVTWFKNLKLPEAHMKRRADQTSIRLSNNNDINAPA